MKQSMEKVRQFLIRRLWSIDPRELSLARRSVLRVGQVSSLVVRDFFRDQCMLQASALTYTTLLSLVPLLALMFAILKGFGVQDFLEPLILEGLAVGSESIVTEIMTYIDNTNFGRLGAVGLVLLLVTALTLLVNIETAFNHIWGVQKNRTLVRCFTDYLSVVVVGPLLLFAAISITTSLRNQELVLRLLETEYLGDAVLVGFALLPFVAMWAAFTFLYIFMTNTKVRFGAALVGGIFGGTLWQLLQWIYVSSQVGVTRYNAIYGTMAALPIFMVWVYVSWLCVLLGLELSHAWQNLRTLRQEAAMGEVSYASREFVTLALLLLIAEDFYRGLRPRSREDLAEELDLPPRLTQRALSDLPGSQLQRHHDGDGGVEVEQESGDEGEGDLAGEAEQPHGRGEQVAEEIDDRGLLQQLHGNVEGKDELDQLPGGAQAVAHARTQAGRIVGDGSFGVHARAHSLSSQSGETFPAAHHKPA